MGTTVIHEFSLSVFRFIGSDDVGHFPCGHTELDQSGHGGDPQETICGPKWFMMHINDLSTPVPLYKYVDDSTLFEICEMNSISLMQESVNVVAEWTNNNDMKMNSEKSKEMIISYARGSLGSDVSIILIYGRFVERSFWLLLYPTVAAIHLCYDINIY